MRIPGTASRVAGLGKKKGLRPWISVVPAWIHSQYFYKGVCCSPFGILPPMVFFILPDKQQPTKTPIHSPNPANIPNAAKNEGLPRRKDKTPVNINNTAKTKSMKTKNQSANFMVRPMLISKTHLYLSSPWLVWINSQFFRSPTGHLMAVCQ